eukprot:8586621-Pyramimonas_sp.AAC.1
MSELGMLLELGRQTYSYSSRHLASAVVFPYLAQDLDELQSWCCRCSVLNSSCTRAVRTEIDPGASGAFG